MAVNLSKKNLALQAYGCDTKINRKKCYPNSHRIFKAAVYLAVFLDFETEERSFAFYQTNYMNG